MSRLIIVSNRLPVTVEKRAGEFRIRRSVGGLATGLASFYRDYDSVWVGWPGITSSRLSSEDRAELDGRLESEFDCAAVQLTDNDLQKYYEGFSNNTLWPLFHYFPQYVRYDRAHWEAYVRVNRKFADSILALVSDGDLVWVHDYHLMLLPQMIREEMPGVSIGFFLHIPFPSFETFRLLPWRTELMEGVLGADLIGFHTYDYVKHFLVGARNLTGVEHSLGEMRRDGHIVKVDSFPMGIDFVRYSEAPDDPAVELEEAKVKAQVGDRKVVLSIDRLDYSKGIPKRLEAIDEFLDRYPDYREKVQFIMVAVPSRTKVEEYALLKQQVDELVGRINGKHATIGWTPVEYIYRSLQFRELIAMYHASHVCLVTPLRDGMNLIAKEYLAATHKECGVLILSEMAGAAKELGEAIIVNPNNRVEMAVAIRAALEMPEEERCWRSERMCQRLQRYNVAAWAFDFIDTLTRLQRSQEALAARILPPAEAKRLLTDYQAASRRLILLDYDGTLVDFAASPYSAAPDVEVLETLQSLSADPSADVVILTGRDRSTLESWLGATGAALVAENGAWVRRPGGDWEATSLAGSEWKDDVRPMMDLFVDRTPGSVVEEKDFALAWHFRKADPELAVVRAAELKDAALGLTTHLDLVVEEADKVLEVRSSKASKPDAALAWLEGGAEFVLAMGGDTADEELFAALPDSAHSIKIGLDSSTAKWNVANVKAARELLRGLAGGSSE
jgi:trehalose 6-phosphate synthase/phosphatase